MCASDVATALGTLGDRSGPLKTKRGLTKMKHPQQPVIIAKNDIPRFKENAIVSFLVKTSRFNLNDIMGDPRSSQADLEQLWQLLGHSVCSFADLFPESRTSIARADAAIDAANAAIVARRERAAEKRGQSRKAQRNE